MTGWTKASCHPSSLFQQIISFLSLSPVFPVGDKKDRKYFFVESQQSCFKKLLRHFPFFPEIIFLTKVADFNLFYIFFLLHYSAVMYVVQSFILLKTKHNIY